MEMKGIHMTDEFAAQYFHKMGWMWGRLEVLKEKETWGDLKTKRIEKELRESIAQEIETYWEQQVKDGIGVHFDFNSKFCFEEAAAIARTNK